MLPGAGDELQGMKRGIIEMLDGMAINKADGDNVASAERARAEYAGALHLFPANADGWTPHVVAISSLTGKNIPELWQTVLDHRARLEANGYFGRRRSHQALQWMHELIGMGLEDIFRRDERIASRLADLEQAVSAGRMTSFAAARELLSTFSGR